MATEEVTATCVTPEGVGSGTCTPDDEFGMVDRTHLRWSENVQNLARWMDGFFGAERAEVEANYSYVRVTPILGWNDTDGTDPNLRVRAKLDLPNTRRRVSLILARARDDDIGGYSESQDLRETLLLDDDENGAFGLQYVPKETRRMHVSLNATVSGDFDPTLSARVRRTFFPTDDTYAYASVKPFWKGDDGAGVTVGGELNSLFGTHTLARFRNEATTAEKINGWEWKSILSLYQQLESRAVLSWTLQVRGVTESEFKAEQYTFGPTYRRSILRPWCFASVQPFVSWRRDIGEDTDRVHGVVFEFDLVLGGRGLRRTFRAAQEAASESAPPPELPQG